jgi:intein-encoded DNA endonuclease-like protein
VKKRTAKPEQPKQTTNPGLVPLGLVTSRAKQDAVVEFITKVFNIKAKSEGTVVFIEQSETPYSSDIIHSLQRLVKDVEYTDFLIEFGY